MMYTSILYIRLLLNSPGLYCRNTITCKWLISSMHICGTENPGQVCNLMVIEEKGTTHVALGRVNFLFAEWRRYSYIFYFYRSSVVAFKNSEILTLFLVAIHLKY